MLARTILSQQISSDFSTLTSPHAAVDALQQEESSVTQHYRLLNIVGYSTSSTLSTIDIRRPIKKTQDY
jgi:hypothetical protein